MTEVVADLSDLDRTEIQRIFSAPGLLATLYPFADATLEFTDLVDEWCRTAPDRDDFRFAIRAHDGRLLGCIRSEEYVLSYFVDPVHWGNGYGTFMMQGVSERVFRRRRSAFYRAFCLRGNPASIRILERAGFRFSGLSNEQYCRDAVLTFTLRT